MSEHHGWADDKTRLDVWWPWIVLAVGVAIVTVGGILFSP